MKLLFPLLLLSFSVSAQTIHPLQNKQVAAILPFIEEMKDFDTGQELFVKVFRVGLPTDRVPNSESEEIYNRVIICLSSDGDDPVYKVYEIQKLYDPKDFSFTKVDKYTIRLKFSYFSAVDAKRKTMLLEMKAEGLTIKKL
ncbi:MAG: hypothetical protein JWN76_800 [Chitinophagaceae bacterium]|nr:hypothetical protein [Chitinophagaceae bacterium]